MEDNKILDFDMPGKESSIIKVLGIGGGGCNAVNYMFEKGIKGVDFIICNTDAQALEKSSVDDKIQIGDNLTGGRGVGGDPELGKRAAEESVDEIKKVIGTATKMLFITAGMGGGTGTGAAPVIAKMSREMDILTVGIITYPFNFEGPKREKIAEEGIEEMKRYVDALIIIHNERLMEMYNGLGVSKAFSHADNVLAIAARGIAEIITVTGIMNVDFEDVKAIMKNSGTAIMGSAVTEGENRAQKAVEEALDSPLLKDKDIRGAKHILLNISYGAKEVQVDELNIITNYIRQEVGDEVDMKFGHCYDANLEGKLSLTLIATALAGKTQEKYAFTLDNEPEEKELPDSSIEIEEERVQVNTEKYKKAVQLNLYDDFKEPYILSDDDQENTVPDAIREIKTPEGLEKIENVPAYIRKKIKLQKTPHSSEIEISKYSLFDDIDKKPGISDKNPYLEKHFD
jgi:cell division protein FtsZ